MDFGISEDQQLLYDTVRGFLAERVPIARVRELEERDSPNDREVWQGLAELGVAGILVSEKQGGSDLTLLDAALVSQALGHAATPSPFLSTCVMAVLALREVDAGSQADAWLGGIAGGELWFGVAATELFSRREGAGISLDGEKLRGKAMLALDCVGADYILVPVGLDRLAVIRGEGSRRIRCGPSTSRAPCASSCSRVCRPKPSSTTPEPRSGACSTRAAPCSRRTPSGRARR
jgi:alkylation response protein AidB-like acyl-CoA dehydrogenase